MHLSKAENFLKFFLIFDNAIEVVFGTLKSISIQTEVHYEKLVMLPMQIAFETTTFNGNFFIGLCFVDSVGSLELLFRELW